MKTKNDIILLELFSGIGGFALGLKQAGFNITKNYFSEIDKHAIANYKYNFTNAEHIGSVTDIQPTSIKKPNIITFGSPCQDFSVAGKRAGIQGAKSSLISQAIKLVTQLKPSIFIWENVKGTYSSNNGADFWAIIAAFTNIGCYRLEWQLLNTSWFLPQNRERIYLIGHLTGASEPRVFPITKNDRLFKQANNSKSTQPQAKHLSTTLTNNKLMANDTFINTNKINQLIDKKNFGGKDTAQQDRVYDTNGLMACISSSRTEGKVNISVKAQRGRKQNNTYVQELENNNTNQSNTLTSATKDNLICENENTIRRLTEIECERLQGFPDNWTKWGVFDTNECIKPISKTQRYKMLGNAVTVNVVKAIATKLLK